MNNYQKKIGIVLAGITAALAPYLWGAARYGGPLLEARREWQAAGPHTTALGELRQRLAGAWWLPGALRPAPPRDPLMECGLPAGDGWWDVLRLLAGAKRHLDCLHEQVRQAEEEQAGFVRTLLVCGCLLLLLAMLAALAAVASSPPSRREGGEETGLNVTPPDKGGDEKKQEETHLEEVKECVQEGPRDTETPAATGKEAGEERMTEVGNEGEEHPSDGCVEKMGEETETEGEEGLENEEDLEKGDTETKEDLVTEEETEKEEEMENKEEVERENDENKEDEVDNANEENKNVVHKETEEDIEKEDHRQNTDNEMEGNENDGQKENEENTAREEGNENEEQEENEENIEKEENKNEHKENEENIEKEEVNENEEQKENEENIEKEEENENEEHKENEENIEKEEENENEEHKENEENIEKEEENENEEHKENEENIEKEEENENEEHKENEENIEKEEENENEEHKEYEESIEKEEENENEEHKENEESIEKEEVNENEEHKEYEESIEKEECSQAADNTNTVEATDDTSHAAESSPSAKTLKHVHATEPQTQTSATPPVPRQAPPQTPTRAPSSASPSTTTPPPANTASFLPPIPRPPPPWDCPPKGYDGSRRALHQELLDFHRWAGGSDAEYQRRLRPVEDLRRVVVTMWPQVRVEATGSLANGLYMADSDVDATLLGHWPASPSPLLALRDALQREGVARLGQLTVLEKTTVPLVKFVHQATGLPVDVSLGSEAAVRAAELVRELLRRFPALAPISLLVRHYLRGLGLAEVFTGGVSSYAVTLMVTSFLQLQIPPDAQHDLGWLLVSFFAFYGYEFNFASTGISVGGRGRYLRKEDVPIVMPRGHRRADLCIQDPLCPTNDLGRSSFRVWDVRRAFQHAYRVLEAALFEPGVYASPCSLLGQLLARHATPQRVLPKWTPPPVPAATGASRTAYEQKKQGIVKRDKTTSNTKNKKLAARDEVNQINHNDIDDRALPLAEAEHRSKHRPGQTRKDDFKKPEQAPPPQPTRTGPTVRVLNRHGRFVTISRKEAADGAFHNQRFH
ncbi:uncharacterized protein LOC126990058 isoform X2 [Eriocheir sinensis]|uniref:uncharacterized protein LOC126990058 isoform X2 n=1 Tax=Eriocheir sinensis TaxID=95602 RepID=UPI0021C9081E|nr:uncharacterized protein LOC126990058 isoform X2 [Eriocheir sinensis]